MSKHKSEVFTVKTQLKVKLPQAVITKIRTLPPVREHWQKTFLTLSRFWPLRGWGGRGGLSEFVKKKICDGNFVSDNFE